MAYLHLSSSATTSNIQNHFVSFTKPTSSAFQDMVIHTINNEHHTENNDSIVSSNSPIEYGAQYMLGQLNLARGNHQSLNPIATGSDEFHLIAPSFVPNFHPYIKIFSLDANTIMHHSQSGDSALGFSPLGSNYSLFETSHYDNSADTFTSKNLLPQSNNNNFPYGNILFKADNNDDIIAVNTGYSPFNCTVGKPFWVKTKFTLEDHDGCSFFFGLAEEDGTDPPSGNVMPVITTGGAGKDKIGFYKSPTDDTISVTITKNTTNYSNSSFSSTHQGVNYAEYDTDNDILSLGIYWDGISKLIFYMNKVKDGENPGHMKEVLTREQGDDTPDANLRMYFAMENNESSIKSGAMEYMQGAVYTTH